MCFRKKKVPEWIRKPKELPNQMPFVSEGKYELCIFGELFNDMRKYRPIRDAHEGLIEVSRQLAQATASASHWNTDSVTHDVRW
jgi:hypothetical protein